MGYGSWGRRVRHDLVMKKTTANENHLQGQVNHMGHPREKGRAKNSLSGCVSGQMDMRRNSRHPLKMH